MVGEVCIFLDECVDVDAGLLVRSAATVEQHCADDAVGALSVFVDAPRVLAEVGEERVKVLQNRRDRLVDVLVKLVVELVGEVD